MPETDMTADGGNAEFTERRVFAIGVAAETRRQEGEAKGFSC
jgi:hypothetical protein